MGEGQSYCVVNVVNPAGGRDLTARVHSSFIPPLLTPSHKPSWLLQGLCPEHRSRLLLIVILEPETPSETSNMVAEALFKRSESQKYRPLRIQWAAAESYTQLF
jgi:hypothetical protein